MKRPSFSCAPHSKSVVAAVRFTTRSGVATFTSGRWRQLWASESRLPTHGKGVITLTESSHASVQLDKSMTTAVGVGLVPREPTARPPTR